MGKKELMTNIYLVVIKKDPNIFLEKNDINCGFILSLKEPGFALTDIQSFEVDYSIIRGRCYEVSLVLAPCNKDIWCLTA